MLHFLVHLVGQLALLVILLAGACGFGLAIVVLLRIRSADPLEHWLFAQTLGLGFLSLVLLALGALKLYYPIVAWFVLVLGIILAAWQSRWQARSHRVSLHWQSAASTAIALILGLVVLLVLVYALFANALTPPVSYDAVAYHLAIPKIYLEANGVTYIPYIVYSNWPLGTEMLFALGMLLGSEFVPQLITWSFAVIIGIGLVSFGRDRMLPWSGPLAAALFFTIPMVATLSGTALVEVPLTCYTFLAFYALWRWSETGKVGWLIASALLSGFAAATKLNAAAVAIVYATMALIFELLQRRPMRGLRAFAGYGAISMLVVLPWYLKSWVLAGDPIWPFLQPLFNGRDWDALGTEYLLGYIRTTNLPLTFKNWLFGPWYLTTDRGKFGSYLLGPYLFAFVPLAALAAVFDRRHRLLLGALSVVSLGLYSIWFLLTHQARFLMPVTPLLALLAAEGVAWLWQVLPVPLRRLFQVGFLAWLVVGVWVFDADRRTEWSLGWGYLKGEANRDAYLTHAFEDYPAFQYANRVLPQDALVLLAPYEVRGYYLDRPYIWANPIGQRFLRMEQIADVAAFSDELRQLGVTHLLLNTRYVFTDIRYWQHMDQLLNGVVAAHGQLLFESAQSQLYELNLSEEDSSLQKPGRVP